MLRVIKVSVVNPNKPLSTTSEFMFMRGFGKLLRIGAGCENQPGLQEHSAPPPHHLMGRERSWRLNPVASDLINHAYIIKPLQKPKG